MKHENLYVKCENLEQREEVFAVCRMNGLNRYDTDDGHLGVFVDENNFFDYDNELSENTTALNYSQFMSKYGKQNMQKLKDKIAEVEKHLNISQRTLSNRMGRSSNYLSSMVLSGCSTDKQGEIIAILDQIKEGAVFQKPEDKIAALEIRLRESTLNNVALHKSLRLQQENTMYWISRNPHTAMQAFKLFIKMLFGVK